MTPDIGALTFFCTKCKEKEIRTRFKVLKFAGNGSSGPRYQAQGYCPHCETKMCKFVKPEIYNQYKAIHPDD